MATSVLEKIGVKKGMRSILVDAPPEAIEAIGLPDDDGAHKLVGSFDYVHVFVTRQAKLDAAFRKLKSHVREGGMLWVSWPKGGALGTDLTLKKVIEIGYSRGLVESKAISVDPTWSAIKFTFPNEGKQYNNSYGKLPKRSP
jgi:hypothetical protein